MFAEVIASLLAKLIVAAVGHEKAPQMVSDEAKRRAYAKADAVARQRQRGG